MKKWYLWLVLALVFAISGIMNYIDDRSVLAQVIQVSIAILLAFIQLICDKKGEKGKKIFNAVTSIAPTNKIILTINICFTALVN